MKIFNNFEQLKSEISHSELNVTIGNFDGVHLGHQDFLAYIKKESDKLKREMVVVTFVPHPSFVLKGRTNFLINTYSERRQLLKNLGVDILIELDFNRDFSTLTPESFLHNYLFSLNSIKKIYLGHDFQFGANKTGNFELAKKEAQKFGVDLILYSEFKLSNEKISSTEIRALINSGTFEKVTNLLGRDFYLSGRVIKGQGRGRQIGFPTANLGYDKDSIIPSKGVYITKTTIADLVYESVTNVGVNPTFNTGYDIHIETHILGFSRDIYGDEIKVSFLKKLRDEKKFSSVNELVNQITSDVLDVKKHFGHV